MPTSFRLHAAGRITALDDLREADRLLDGVPRTWAIEREHVHEAWGEASPILRLSGLGSLLEAGRPTQPGTPTRALTEFHEALSLMERAADAMDPHPVAMQLRDCISAEFHRPLPGAALSAAAVVRASFDELRHLDDLVVPPLTDWSRHDHEDDAAVRAAGLGVQLIALRVTRIVRSRGAIVVAAAVLLALLGYLLRYP